MIHILFTGGTISMQRDDARGGNVPTLGGAALVGFAPELPSIAEVRIDDWAKRPAAHLDNAALSALRDRVAAVAADPAVRGIVITHGTDTIEETAYLLARTVSSPVPVVVTGAMRTHGEADWDGTRNLTDAVRVAADPASAGRGVLVVFNGRIIPGHLAVKLHTMALDAFGAPHGADIGRVRDGAVEYLRPSARPAVSALPAGLTARVALVPAITGDDGALAECARAAFDGLVVVGYGSGNVPPGLVPALGRWLADGKPVVLASRCPTGEVTPIYGFDGGSATTVRMGLVPAGPRTAAQARLELAIALSAGVAYGA